MRGVFYWFFDTFTVGGYNDKPPKLVLSGSIPDRGALWVMSVMDYARWSTEPKERVQILYSLLIINKGMNMKKILKCKR